MLFRCKVKGTVCLLLIKNALHGSQTSLRVYMYLTFRCPLGFNIPNMMLQLLLSNSDYSVQQQRAVLFPAQSCYSQNYRKPMVPWELRCHSAASWQQNTLLSDGTYSCAVVLGALVKGCGKSLGEPFFFSLASCQSLSALVFSRQRLQRWSIYSSDIHLKVRSLNINWERMWLAFSSPPPASRRGMLGNVVKGWGLTLGSLVVNWMKHVSSSRLTCLG